MQPNQKRSLLVAPRWSLLLGAVVAISLVLALAGWWDRQRRTAQLAAIEAEDCEVVLPEKILRLVRGLTTRGDLTQEHARKVARRVGESFLAGRSVEIVYERRGRLWVVHAHHGPGAAGARNLRPGGLEWPKLVESRVCRGGRDRRSFVVVQSVLTGTDAPAVIITRQSMSP